jgi:Ulp1 family protease
MTTLKGKGPEDVVSWTEKKDINIFEKKLIFIPVNADLHWSLLVVVNPGMIANVYNDDLPETEEHSFILHLDSLKMHNTNVYAKHIRRWLNFEHRRLGREEVGGRIDPFDENIPVISPKSTYFNSIYFIFTTMGSNHFITSHFVKLTL